jgi:hypothetical protein
MRYDPLLAKARTDAERTTMMTIRLSAWITGLLVICAFMCTALAQAHATDKNDAAGILPSGFGDSVDRDVAKIRETTAKFQTSQAAEAAGYKLATGCVQHQPAGAMGYHFNNAALFDATLDVEHPEVLVYEKRQDGTFQLNGVEFYVPASAWKSTEPPRILGQELKTAPGLGFWFLHVWTWKRSPSGLFSVWNPDVKCEDASSMNHH